MDGIQLAQLLTTSVVADIVSYNRGCSSRGKPFW